MFRGYEPAGEVLATIEKWVRANIDTCGDTIYDDVETDHAEYLAGQLAAFNMVLNLLTTVYAVPQPEVDE